MTRVGIVDDQELVRDGLRMMVGAEPDLEVVLEAENGQRLLDALASGMRLDVVLLDLRMPVLDGIATLDALQRIEHRPRTLVVTTFERDELVLQALARGADGYLVKRGSRTELVNAVRQMAAGRSVLSPAVTHAVIDHVRQQPSGPSSAPGSFGLTTRETEVLRLVGRGLSNREIADELTVSPHTIKTHLTSVLAKTQCRDRVHAVLLAAREGLV